MHENRETCWVSAQADRSGKANSHNPDMYAQEESDCAVVPMKQPNKGARASAEVVEGRAQAKENDAGPDTSPTQCGERVSQGLGGVRQAIVCFDVSHPRQEPYAVIPLVRICAGGGQRWPSLPRPHFSSRRPVRPAYCGWARLQLARDD